MRQAATNFLAALPDPQRVRVAFPFDSDQRTDWHFIPKERKGLPFKDMSPEQRQLGEALLSSGLGQRGFLKAVTIMSLDQILRDLENNNAKRDPELYYITIFGTPSPTAPWGWSVEGHHLSVNLTVAGDGAVSSTPAFFGTNPAEVREGPRKGLRVLAQEEDLGRELVKSLDDVQRQAAIFSVDAPKDVITGNSRKVTLVDAPAGIAVGRLNDAQRLTLRKLIEEYLHRHRADLANEEWKKIEAAGLDRIHFGWAGGVEPGQGHYYRIHGPTFLIEYDNTQNNANHVHTVWRDLQNDFGEDLLRRHHEQHPHPAAAP